MGRELQKKKLRSSIPKIKMKQKSKKVNPRGNAIIAANWYETSPQMAFQPKLLLLDIIGALF